MKTPNEIAATLSSYTVLSKNSLMKYIKYYINLTAVYNQEVILVESPRAKCLQIRWCI